MRSLSKVPRPCSVLLPSSFFLASAALPHIIMMIWVVISVKNRKSKSTRILLGRKEKVTKWMGEFNEKLIDYLNRFVIVVKSYNEMPMVGYNLFDLETNQISLTFLELFSTSLFVRLFSHSKIRLKKRLYFKGGGCEPKSLWFPAKCLPTPRGQLTLSFLICHKSR